MSGVLTLIIWWGFLALMFLNIVGVLIVWKTMKVPTIVKLQPVDEQLVPAKIRALLREHEAALQALGFDLIVTSVFPYGAVRTYLRVYWNRELRLAGTAVAAKGPFSRVRYLEFTQQYADCSTLTATNMPIAGAYPSLPTKRMFRFRRLADPAALLQCFLILSPHFRSAHPIVDYDVTRGVSGLGAIEDAVRAESDTMLAMGLVAPEIDQNGRRALTLKGAVSLTYRAVPPGNLVWSLITARRSERALAECRQR